VGPAHMLFSKYNLKRYAVLA